MKTKTWIVFLVCLLLISGALAAPTENIIYNFSFSDGAIPYASLITDGKGNLYGTTSSGGANYGGEVFELSPSNGNWMFNILYSFNPATGDGGSPYSSLVFDNHGNLYGTTELGGEYGVGTVYELSLSNGSWSETRLYSFHSENGDGEFAIAAVIVDKNENVYGTMIDGGYDGGGMVYELMPSGEGWTESIIYSFDTNDNGLYDPNGAVAMDQNGNLYGTAANGGQYGVGGVYELTLSNGTWTQTVLHEFAYTEGGVPATGVTLDGKGNLYGTTTTGGTAGQGVAFELTPSNGSWQYTTLYNFCSVKYCPDGAAPYAALTLDKSGNLYGTTLSGGHYDSGVVFQLKRSGKRWVEHAYQFQGGVNGGFPWYSGALVLNGDVYGTLSAGGGDPMCVPYGCGVVYQIVP